MVEILGIPIYDKCMEAAVSTVVVTCTDGQSPRSNHLISATGAHGLVYAKKIPEFAEILKSFTMNLPDGKPNEWVGRLKGRREMRRCRGTDFFVKVMIRSASHPIRHFLCGGKEGVPEQLRKACIGKFSNTNIVGTYSPPFGEMTDQDLMKLAERINTAGTDILWIGLSTPKQERFATRIAQYTRVHYIAAVGAAFDFHSGGKKEAPKIIQDMGLEWFFRLCTEPKRLYKRYAEIVPLFIFYNLIEFLNSMTARKR
ncbi:MAG: WecB/TagA/CpsF family glycosyltransferase [Nitrososphaera sp.]|nr:WecB/TagA/CpsF family glycosyltransferase [Nitrososphaera sp.]